MYQCAFLPVVPHFGYRSTRQKVDSSYVTRDVSSTPGTSTSTSTSTHGASTSMSTQGTSTSTKYRNQHFLSWRYLPSLCFCVSEIRSYKTKHRFTGCVARQPLLIRLPFWAIFSWNLVIVTKSNFFSFPSLHTTVCAGNISNCNFCHCCQW